MIGTKIKNKIAFTLIESLVILSIISLGVLASLSLAIKSSRFQGLGHELSRAMFLSREGLELMINIRDTNIITSRLYNDWNYSGIGNSSEFFKLDYSSLVAIDNEDDVAMLQINDEGFYLHDSNYPDSIFSRVIKILDQDDDNTIIESCLTWKNRGVDHEYKLETILYDLSF